LARPSHALESLTKTEGPYEDKARSVTTMACPPLRAGSQRTAELTQFLLMPILAQAFFAFVRRHFVTLALPSTGQTKAPFWRLATGRSRLAVNYDEMKVVTADSGQVAEDIIRPGEKMNTASCVTMDSKSRWRARLRVFVGGLLGDALAELGRRSEDCGGAIR
jgi:hypothetical protein